MSQSDASKVQMLRSSSSAGSETETQFHLWCWWHNPNQDLEDPASMEPIRIKIEKKLQFLDLREKIKLSFPNRMKDIDEVDIKMWVVDSPLQIGPSVNIEDATRQATGDPIKRLDAPLSAKFDSITPGFLRILFRTQGTCVLFATMSQGS
jgi:hypothetical protein